MTQPERDDLTGEIIDLTERLLDDSRQLLAELDDQLAGGTGGDSPAS
jgi:hypothetical protein